MRNSVRCLSTLMLLGMTCAVVFAQKDGGGRDVTVALFSTRSVKTATLTPVSGAWIARCAACAHQLLTAPIKLGDKADIFAGGTLRLTDNASGQERTASGLFHLRTNDANQELDAVLTMPSERYVEAVLNAEARPQEPAESLKALAIVARTYALNGTHFPARPGHLRADLCDSTECQAMHLERPSEAIRDATRATAGETLWFGNHRAEVFFSQHCGGQTEDAGAVWPRLRGVSYLPSHADPYCIRRDPAGWHTEVPLKTFAELAKAEGWGVPGNILDARVYERSASHRAVRIVFTGSDGASAVVSASALRFALGRALGWDHVRSDAYELKVRNDSLVFDGHGHGHGVGLCQMGATEMASEGKSAHEILAFYFPGTTVRVLPRDHGWQQASLGPLTLHSTEPISAERRTELAAKWNDALQRFPSPRFIAGGGVEIVFAPSTEVFRQLTAQPGWDLASTRGRTIVMQPERIFRANGQAMSATLLHEMLHVLVESEASERTPLWLREGLVEVLNQEVDHREAGLGFNTMTPLQIDNGLQQADSMRASERAHLAAANRVRAIVARYGLGTVRDWLAHGVPAGVA